MEGAPKMPSEDDKKESRVENPLSENANVLKITKEEVEEAKSIAETLELETDEEAEYRIVKAANDSKNPFNKAA